MTPLLTPAAAEVPFLAELALIVAAAAAFGYACQRLKIVPIVGFLLAGVAVGGLARAGVAGEVDTVAALAEYGVILLLFTIGLEFSLNRLAAIKTLIFGGGTLQVAGTVGVVALATFAFAGWPAAVFTGCLVSLSSTAIVLKLLADGGRSGTTVGRASLGVLIFQDLAVVAMVMLVPMLAGQGGGAIGLGWALVKAGLVIAIVVLLARRLVPIVLEFVAKTCRGEIFLLSVIAVCVVTAWATSLAGISAALGAFLGGLMVSESKFRHHALGEVMPLQILFSATFFVSVGMLLDPAFALANAPLVALIVVATVAIKTVVTTASLRAAGLAWRPAIGGGLVLAQVGEFAFVLATAGAALGLMPLGREDGFDLFIAASVVLMLATPLLARVGVDLAGARATPSEAGGGHVVIAGWGEHGRRLAGELREANVPLVVVTLSPAGADEAEAAGHQTVRGATDRAAAYEEARADAARLIVIAADDAETAERAANVARQIASRGSRARIVVVSHERVDAADEVRHPDDAAMMTPANLGVA